MSSFRCQPIRNMAFAFLALGMIALPLVSAQADGGRVVVVGPNQGPQPLGPNEEVKAAKTVVVNGERITIIRVGTMPLKPKFVVGMWLPLGGGRVMMYFPFPPDTDDDGVHESWQHEPAAGGALKVFRRRSVAGGHCDDSVQVFPPGSVIIPDPPQPAGLYFMAERFPTDPPTEAAVLDELGLPDNPGPDVWTLTTGDVYFYIDGNPAAAPVHIEAAIQPGDVNCDGATNTLDVEPFVGALLDPAGHDTAHPDCGSLNADLNDDRTIDALDVATFTEVMFNLQR